MKENSTKKKIVIIVVAMVLGVLLGMGVYQFAQPKQDSEVDKKGNNTNVNKVNSPYRMSGNSIEDFDLYFMQLENKKQNMIYSPLSIKYALEMLSEGASGNSKDQIDALIGDYQAKSYSNNANMSFANALFVRDSYKNGIKPDYITTLKNNYNAEIIYDPFATSKNLNSWVSNKTFDLIKDLFKDEDVSEASFILTNSLAIDMEWNYLIQAAYPNKGNVLNYSVVYAHENYSDYIAEIMDESYNSLKFNNTNAKSVEIGASINNYDIVSELGEENIRKTVGEAYEQWVKQEECGPGPYTDTQTFLNEYIEDIDSNYKKVDYSTDFRFYNDDNVKVFAKELKKYDDTTLEYIGIMPKNTSLDEYIKNINANEMNKIINSLKTIELNNFTKGKITNITGYIPLFKFDYELTLMDDLKKLGITDIFEPNKADLSNITSDNNMYIYKASHKANIEFSNEGIKAAAATSYGGGGDDSCYFDYLYDVPVETIDMTFDKPYMFLIIDKDTKEVWFAGSVYEPTPYTEPVYQNTEW